MAHDVKKLNRFLKDNGVYTSYWKNCKIPLSDRMWSFPRGYITCAFCWCETVEGHYFWDDINTEWCKFCDKHFK